MQRGKPFGARSRLRGKMEKEGAAMIREEEKPMVSGMDIYRGVILGLVGLFYGFLVFLMFI
jgi:hypothetical protein